MIYNDVCIFIHDPSIYTYIDIDIDIDRDR